MTFRGTAIGADGETFGEMVFNTGMTGYQETLTDPSYCRQIVAMSGTRALTRHLRERGAMRAAISTREAAPARLLERVLASPAMSGADLAREVSTAEPYTVRPPAGTPVRYRVAAVDLGIKAATPRAMAPP